MKNYLLLIAFACLLISCGKDGWFDVKSNKQLAIPTTIKDLQALMDNSFTFNSYSPSMGENASDYHYFSDAVLASLSGFERNSYLWTKEQPNLNVADWTSYNTGSYYRIYVSNLVLEQARKIKPANQTEEFEVQNIIGQALFQRARTYYELAQEFVPYYTNASAQSKLSIPLRTESDINVPSVRSTVQEQFDLILDDLKTAQSFLPETPTYKTRASRIACFALLARIYLSIENYELALENVNKVLKVRNELIDYSGLDYSSSTNPFKDYNDEIIFYSNLGGAAYFSQASVLVKQEVFELYDVKDLRRKVFFNVDGGIVSYKGTYSGDGFPYFFNGLAIDEMYLIRSECYIRSGNVSAGIHDLNTLLKKRFEMPYDEIVESNIEEALKLVLEERRKELIFRGVRWSDLRRLNRDPRFAKTFTRVVNGKNYTLEPNSYKYTFPIPDDVIQITGMQQNPGW